MQSTPVFLPREPLEQYNKGAWRAAVHGATRSWTRLSD